VNSLHPTNVNTPMLVNPGTLKMFRPDLDDPQVTDALDSFSAVHALEGMPWVEPEDVSNAILYLVSDEGRFVSGSQFAVDGGFMVK
jgi:NAD(P)-dependent dehydrogenase (short-subunit alcohol dehydrogenase family)